MKKVMKRVITACLAFAMILALVTPASVEAATKNDNAIKPVVRSFVR